MELKLEIVIHDNSSETIKKWLDVFILDGYAYSEKFLETFDIKFKCGPMSDILNDFDAIINLVDAEEIAVGSCVVETHPDYRVICAPIREVGTKDCMYAVHAALRWIYWYNKHHETPITRILLPNYGPPEQFAQRTFMALLRYFKPSFSKKSRHEHFSETGYIWDKEVK